MELFVAILVALPIFLLCFSLGKSAEIVTSRIINGCDV